MGRHADKIIHHFFCLFSLALSLGCCKACPLYPACQETQAQADNRKQDGTIEILYILKKKRRLRRERSHQQDYSREKCHKAGEEAPAKKDQDYRQDNRRLYETQSRYKLQGTIHQKRQQKGPEIANRPETQK